MRDVFTVDVVEEFVNSMDFAKDKPIRGARELASPVILWSCMRDIYPEWFDASVHPSCFEGEEDAMETLLHFIDEFHEQKFTQTVNELKGGRKELLAGQTDLVVELYKLVVMAVIHASDQQAFIDKMVSLSRPSQMAIQQLVEDIGNENETSDDVVRAFTRQLTSAMTPSGVQERTQSTESVLSKRDDALIANLRSEISVLKQRLAKTETEKETLQEQAQKADKLLREAQQKNENSEAHLGLAKESLMKKFADQSEEYEKQIKELKTAMESEKKEKKKVEDKLKQDMKELQDDLDISKSQLGQIASLENQVAKYKGKLQEMAELQESNRQLQEQNKECVDKMVQMEQDSKHVTTLRKSLETYKDRLADLDAKLSSAIHDKEEQESLVVELKRKLTETEKKLELRDAEVAQAKAEAESLKAELNEAKTGNKAGSDIDNSDLNLRTDYARLQRENEILKESSGTVDQEKLLQLENELDDLKRVKEKLEKNCTAANAKISVLLKQLDVSAGSGEDAKKLQELTEKNTELTGKAAEMEGKCEEKDTEIRKLRESHDELTKKMMDLISQKDAPRSNGMDEVMKAKLAALEAQLDAERRQGALQEDLVTARLEKQYDRVLTTIKEQLQIRDRENDFYKKTLEEQVDVNKKEQRLMMSVFYEIGLRYHQLRAYCEQLKNENEAVILRLQSRLAPHEPEDGKPEEPPDQKEASLSGADKAESD